jgi:hypothetical protein
LNLTANDSGGRVISVDDYVRLPYVLPPDVLRDAAGRLRAAYQDVRTHHRPGRCRPTSEQALCTPV